MKIGILTFHRAENFGAALQVYALQEKLKSLGYEVNVIDYRCNAIEQKYKLFTLGYFFERKNIFISLQTMFERILTFNLRKNKRSKYILFWNKYLQLSKSCTLKNIPTSYDYYICGSDQIWNPGILNGIDPVFFLDFIVKKGSKKIAYAASLEEYNYPFINEHMNDFSKLINNIDSVSVREKSVAALFQPYVNSKITTVLDPTFLIPAQIYKSILIKPIETKYILVYHLTWSKEAIDTAKFLVKNTKLKIIQIYAGLKPFRFFSNSKQNLGPEELLGYINNAECIITTSFHGMALSIILQKQFFVINKGAVSRQCELLTVVGLRDRLINNYTEIIDVKEIDYHSVSSKLDINIYSSEQFLIKSIETENIN